MTGYTEKKCSECGQLLRVPDNIGGMLMACPSCGKKLHSDFKLGSSERKVERNVLVTLFEMPGQLLNRLVRYYFKS